MELSYIPKSGTWSEMANLLNGNFGSIISEIGALGDNLDLCKGVFDTLAHLQGAYSSPQLNSWAYVFDSGTTFKIYRYQGTPTPSWQNTGKTEDLGSIDLGNFTAATVKLTKANVGPIIAQAYSDTSNS